MLVRILPHELAIFTAPPPLPTPNPNSSTQTGSAIKASTSSSTVSSDYGNVTVWNKGLTALTTYYISCYRYVRCSL